MIRVTQALFHFESLRISLQNLVRKYYPNEKRGEDTVVITIKDFCMTLQYEGYTEPAHSDCIDTVLQNMEQHVSHLFQNA